MIDRNSKLYQIFKEDVTNLIEKRDAKEITGRLSIADEETRFEMVKVEPRCLKYFEKEYFTDEIKEYISKNLDWGLREMIDRVGEDNLSKEVIKGCLKNSPLQIGCLSNPTDDLIKYAFHRHKKILESHNARQSDLDFGLVRMLHGLYNGKENYILSDSIVEFLISEYKDSKNAIKYILRHANLSQLDKLPDELKLYIELQTNMDGNSE